MVHAGKEQINEIIKLSQLNAENYLKAVCSYLCSLTFSIERIAAIPNMIEMRNMFWICIREDMIGENADTFRQAV